MERYTASDWGDVAYCIVNRRDGDRIESVPITKRGRVYMTLSRYVRFRIADGKAHDRFYGGYSEYYPTEQLADLALKMQRIMRELRPLFSFPGDRVLEKLELKSLEELRGILIEPFEEED